MSEPESQETVAVNTTPTFYDTDAMKKAAELCRGDKASVLFAWARIELARGARIQANTTVLQNAAALEQRFVNTAGFHALAEAGMIIVDSPAIKKVMTDTHFEKFWEAMPQRTTDSGKKTRGVKSKAKQTFYIRIQTQQQFDELLKATAEYATVAGEYPKDAERFLRIYRDYLPDSNAVSTTVVASSKGATVEEKQRIEAERQERMMNANNPVDTA